MEADEGCSSVKCDADGAGGDVAMEECTEGEIGSKRLLSTREKKERKKESQKKWRENKKKELAWKSLFTESSSQSGRRENVTDDVTEVADKIAQPKAKGRPVSIRKQGIAALDDIAEDDVFVFGQDFVLVNARDAQNVGRGKNKQQRRRK